MAFPPIIVFALFVLLSGGPRELGQVENIQGIPYPAQNNVLLITEPLAHADIYLKESVLAKELILDIIYRPINLKSLAIGVREDSFWLSYGQRQSLPISDKRQAISLVIPLTDKLADKDGSIDLMFFAESEGDPLWELHDVKAKVQYAKPTYRHFKNYIRSLVTQEKAL